MATTRGYVAVNFSFDARTDKVTCTARKDMTITGENGASVTLKAGEKFTAVRAASLGENMWYIVRQVSGVKKCSCPATKPCKHEKLVAASKVATPVESMTIRPIEKATEAEAIVAAPKFENGFKHTSNWATAQQEKEQNYIAIRNEMREIRARREEEERLVAPLNGNRGFRLMR
jgi:ribosomal protein L14E/L6E/L27E